MISRDRLDAPDQGHFKYKRLYTGVFTRYIIFIVRFGGEYRMILSLDIWLLPAIAAGASSYLVCLTWEHYSNRSAPNGMLAGFLVCLSFIMGAVSAYYRQRIYSVSMENNIIVMFAAGVVTTFFWLLLRKHLPVPNGRNNSRRLQ
jgi:glucan phosphoethanolaminetransferase (alkaline phosphatase superfamily)